MTPGELREALEATARAVRLGYAREVSPDSVRSVPAVTAAFHRLSSMEPDALIDALAATAERLAPGDQPAQYRAALEMAYVCGRLAVARRVFDRALVGEFSAIYRGMES
jgi:hypothetical protein